jgi:hypothetical protein
MLIAGGDPLDAWKKGKAAEFRELYAFDAKTETVGRLADCPTAFYATHMAYDRKNDVFFAVVVFDKGEQPSGIFAYDPKRDVWREIKSANPNAKGTVGPRNADVDARRVRRGRGGQHDDGGATAVVRPAEASSRLSELRGIDWPHLILDKRYPWMELDGYTRVG